MTDNWYSTSCRHSVQYFSWLVGDLERFKKMSEKSVSQEFLDSINFCGYEIEPYESHLLAISGTLVSFLLLLIVTPLFRLLANYHALREILQHFIINDRLIALFDQKNFPIFLKKYYSGIILHKFGE